VKNKWGKLICIGVTLILILHYGCKKEKEKRHVTILKDGNYALIKFGDSELIGLGDLDKGDTLVAKVSAIDPNNGLITVAIGTPETPIKVEYKVYQVNWTLEIPQNGYYILGVTHDDTAYYDTITVKVNVVRIYWE